LQAAAIIYGLTDEDQIMEFKSGVYDKITKKYEQDPNYDGTTILSGILRNKEDMWSIAQDAKLGKSFIDSLTGPSVLADDDENRIEKANEFLEYLKSDNVWFSVFDG